MFFNGGLIPNYILITSSGFKNTLWAIVLPNAISVFNLLVMKAFFENFPSELEEAAVDRRPEHLRHLLQDRAAAEQGGGRDDGALLRGLVLELLVRRVPLHGRAELYPVTVYLRNLIAGATGGTSIQGGGTDNVRRSAPTSRP